MWARKKIPKICGRDFLAYTREKKSTRFVGEIFTRFSSLSPRKKNLQDLWDYFLGSKINKICGPHILLIFFLQEKWIYPQDSHVSCPRNSKISLEELYPCTVDHCTSIWVHSLYNVHGHTTAVRACPLFVYVQCVYSYCTLYNTYIAMYDVYSLYKRSNGVRAETNPPIKCLGGVKT